MVQKERVPRPLRSCTMGVQRKDVDQNVKKLCEYIYCFESNQVTGAGWITYQDRKGTDGCDVRIILTVISENFWIIGEVPEYWRKSNISPIFKRGEKSVVKL